MTALRGESHPIELLGVVVPVLDEIERISACLDALDASLANLRRLEPTLAIRLVVVDDGSTDGSDVVVAGREGVELLGSGARHVGVARAVGVRELLAARDPGRVWIATTDGDSRVPLDWAAHHLDIARTGAGALLGSIRPDPQDLSPEQLARWHRLDRPATEHDHIHGANLGVRGDHYLRVGGFAPVAADEDVDLVGRLRAAGVVVVSSDTAPVVTSARVTGRVPDGFARFVADELAPVGKPS